MILIKLKFILIICLVGKIRQIKSEITLGEWEQCGGIGYTGLTTCSSGLACVKINDHYYNCEKLNSVLTSTQAPISYGLIDQCNAHFPNGNFRTGISYDQITTVDLNNYDYVTIWINTISNKLGTDFDPSYHGKMIEFCLANNKLPVFYSYIIGYEAQYRLRLQHCDVRTRLTLCRNGSEFIRNNKQLLLDRYRHHASSIASYAGKYKTVLFLMEPDFWQYYGDKRQVGGPLSGNDMRDLFDEFVEIIKEELPNALISWDISPWIGDQEMRTWWSFFSSSNIDLIHSSGGHSLPYSARIKINQIRWLFMSRLTKKYIIADCGYWVAGNRLIANCRNWLKRGDLVQRINDGVIALNVANQNGVVPRLKFRCNQTSTTTTTRPATQTTTRTTTKAATTQSSNSSSEWTQCGGTGYTGSTSCQSGFTCTRINDYFYQCQSLSALNGIVEWGQCGGINYFGSTTCYIGLNCVRINDYYYQCQRTAESNAVNLWGQCGGINYSGLTNCATGLTCVRLNDHYSQCRASYNTK